MLYYNITLDLVLGLPNPDSVDHSGTTDQLLRFTVQTWIENKQASWEQLVSALLSIRCTKAANSLRRRVTNLKGIVLIVCALYFV